MFSLVLPLYTTTTSNSCDSNSSSSYYINNTTTDINDKDNCIRIPISTNNDTSSSNVVHDDDDDDVIQKPIVILVADDSTMNRKYLIRTLNMILSKELKGMFIPSFIEVDDGHGVVNHISNTPSSSSLSLSSSSLLPDIIFMDNIMKELNGPEACKIIRGIGYTGIVIGLSGNVLDDDVTNYLNSGANYFMSKPIDSIQLTSYLRNVYDTIPSMVTDYNV